MEGEKRRSSFNLDATGLIDLNRSEIAFCDKESSIKSSHDDFGYTKNDLAHKIQSTL